MKKILITGCSGYIGSHLCKMLEKDYLVYGLDITTPKTNIKEYYNIDITKTFEIDREFDVVIHLAALVNAGESEKIPISYYITNLNGTMNVINKIKCNNFIFASTGLADICPNAYGISKRAAEDVVREFYTVHRPSPYTIFRFYNVFGSDGFNPTNPDGLMHKLMLSEQTREFTIFGTDYDTPDGTCVRDYVHVNEVCEAIRTAIEHPANQIECLGHGVGRSVHEMFETFKIVNAERLALHSEPILRKIGPRRPGDAPISVLTTPSLYMKNLYSFDDLLKLPKA